MHGRGGEATKKADTREGKRRVWWWVVVGFGGDWWLIDGPGEVEGLLEAADTLGFLVWDENHRNEVSGQFLDDLRAMLRSLPDIGRALGRLVAGRGSPRDLGQMCFPPMHHGSTRTRLVRRKALVQPHPSTSVVDKHYVTNTG